MNSRAYPAGSLAIEDRPSPNFGPRVGGQSIDILVLHYTGMPTEAGAIAWLCDPRSQVSSHYVVGEEGRIVRLVAESDRAWHAGKSFWAGVTDVNSRSIGIEIANPGHEFGYRPFPDVQIDAVIALCRDVLSRHSIPAERVLAHSDIAPMRKEDPGELFPWERLHREGVGHWVPPETISAGASLQTGDRGGAVAALKKRFREYGYGLADTEEFDPEMEAVVRAFQRHFRPSRCDGIADPSTAATLERLLRAMQGN